MLVAHVFIFLKYEFRRLNPVGQENLIIQDKFLVGKLE